MGEPRAGQSIAVWFSCGAASAVAAKETIRRYGNLCAIHVVNNPVAEEDEDNRRFLRDVEQWLGVEIEIATNEAYPDASAMTVWDRRGGMSFPHGAPCTIELKKVARQQWEARNPVDWHVLGFGAEERGRYERFTLTERPNTLPILIDAGLTRQDCYEIIVAEGLEPPRIYALGYPNANCIGCVKATSPTYWNHVRKVHPEVFDSRAEQSRRLGSKLARVNNERIFLDELSPLAMGKPLKSLKMPECGLFCEEHDAPPPKQKESSMMKVYLAHPVVDYGTTRQNMAVLTVEKMGWTVENPDQPRHQAGYKTYGMTYFADLISECGALAFLPFWGTTKIGAGVGQEIERALFLGLPVFEIHELNMVMEPLADGWKDRVLSVEETRRIIAATRVESSHAH